MPVTVTLYNSMNIDEAYYPTWVAVANTTVGASSLDPITGATPWVARTISSSTTWNSCCFGDKLVVAVGNTATGACTADGITWRNITLPSIKTWQSVIYGNGVFIAVARGDNVTARSTDGGTTWVSGGVQNDIRDWYSIAYGDPIINGTPTPMFVAVAETNSTVASRSIDNGLNWTRTTITSGNWRSVCYGNGRFVAIGHNSNKVAYSTNGIDWSDATLPTSRNWHHVCYGNGLYVAVAFGTNVAAYSSNGVDWTEVRLPATADWVCTTYGTIQSANQQGLPAFCTIARSNAGLQTAISYDGITWFAAIGLNAAYNYQCYAPFPWNSGDTLSIQNNSTITVTTNQDKFWNTITATYGKLKIENTSSVNGNYFQMGRVSGSGACSLTVGSGLFDVDIDGDWIYLDNGNDTAGQTFTAPFIEYIPMIEVETSTPGVYEQWLNVTGAFGPYMKIFGKDGLEWVGNGKRGNYFVQTPAANPINIPILTGGSTITGSYYISFAAVTPGTILPGANITGTGIPVTAVVNRVISTTRVELSEPCTATNTGLTLTVYNPMRAQLTNQLVVGDGINGNKVPVGRKVRCPNLMISNSSPVNYSGLSNLTDTYINMTNACPIDARICMFGIAYVLLSQPSKVYFRNVGFSYQFALTECYDVDMDFVGVAASPAYWYYSARWICRDQRWGIVPPFGYTIPPAGAGQNAAISFIHNAKIKNFHKVCYSPSSFTTGLNSLALAQTNDSIWENIRISCLWLTRQQFNYVFDSVIRTKITNLELYGANPLSSSLSTDNEIDGLEYSQGMTSTIKSFKTTMRICDDPATKMPLVDNTKYYFKLRSFRTWLDRSVYFDSNEYSCTPFQGGWQFPDHLSVRPTETIARSVTIDWVQRAPSPANLLYEIYRSETPGFTDRSAANRVYGSAVAATVTCAQGVKVVTASAAARIMTFSAATRTIVLSGASAGTWTGYGYVVGDTIYITGSYNGNDGAKTVTAISTVTMTVAEELFDEVGTLNPLIHVFKTTTKSQPREGGVARGFVISAARTITIPSATYAWTTIDGLAIGDVIDISGSRTYNNGTFTINAITTTVITVNEPTTAETVPNSVSVVTTRIFTFSAAAKTLTASGTSPGSFITDGWVVGDIAHVFGSTLNPGPFTVAAVSATVLTFVESPVNETCAASTVIYRRMIITLRAPVDGTRYQYRFRKYNFNSISTLSCVSPGFFRTTNRAVTSNVATITTAVAHGFIAGQQVVVSGLEVAAYNGTRTIIAVPSATTFTYALVRSNETVADTSGRVTASDSIVDTPNPYTHALRTSTRAVSNNIATIATAIPHKFVVNQSIIITSMTDATYNGTFKILSVPTPTTFTYALTRGNESTTADTAGRINNLTLFSASNVTARQITTAQSISDAGKTMTFNAAAGTIVLSSGTWAADGFSIFDTIYVTGSLLGNNKTYTIRSLSAGTLTIVETGSSGFNSDEVGSSSPVITITGQNMATLTTPIAHGLVFGQSITVYGVGNSAYNGTFTVRAVPTTVTVQYPVVHANEALTPDNVGKITTSAWDFDNVYYLSGFRFEQGTRYITNLVNNIYNSMFAPGVEISGQGIVPGTKVVSVDPSGREMIIDTDTTMSTSTIFATTFTVVRRQTLTNVVTIQTSVAHNLSVGSRIRLTEMSDPSYNGTFVITAVLSATRLRFSLTRVDEVETINLSGVLTVVDIVLTIPVQAGMNVYGVWGTTDSIPTGAMVVSKESSSMITLSHIPYQATQYTNVLFQTFNESPEFTCVPKLYAKAMNFCLQSRDFSTTWTNSNITYGANTYQSPNMFDWATGSMDSLTATADNATMSTTVTGLAPLTQYTASVWVRADQTVALPNGVAGRISFGSTNTDFFATNDIKRVSATATTGAGITSLNLVIRVNTNGRVIHAGEVMVNLGPVAQAPIPTTTTAVELFPSATPITQLRAYARNKVSSGTTGNQGIEVNLGTAVTGEYFHEIYVSTTPGFVPNESTLATSSFVSDSAHISFSSCSSRNKVKNILKLGAGSAAAALGVLYFTTTSTNNVIQDGDIDIQYCNSATIPIIYFLTAAHNNLIHNINFGRVRSYQAANFIFTQSTNAVTGNRVQNIRAINYDVPISNQMLNTQIKAIPSGRAMPSTTTTTYAIGGTIDGVSASYTAVYGSQFYELYNSDTDGLLCIAMEDSQTDVKPYTIKAGRPTFTNTGRLAMFSANSVATVSRKRLNNIATIQTIHPHKILVGDEIVVSGLGGTGYNGIQTVLSIPNSMQFTYASIGNAEVETADINGTVTVGDSIEWTFPYKILGISGFRKLLPKILTIDMGTQTDIPDGLKIEVSIKTLETDPWGGYIEATPDNLSTLSVSPTTGFYFRCKLTAMLFMKYGTMTYPFVVGETIMGSRSGASAVVVADKNYGATGTLILKNLSGTFIPSELIVQKTNITLSTTHRAVTSNVATITTSTAHGMNAGFWVIITGISDVTYNGTYIVASVPTPTTFTYVLTRANEGTTADTGGTVLLRPNRATNVATNGFALGPSFTSFVNVIQFFTSYNDHNSLYPVQRPYIILTGLQPTSEVRVYKNDMTELAGVENIGASTTFIAQYDYYEDVVGYIVIIADKFLVHRIENITFGINGYSAAIQQVIDRQYKNPI